MQSIVSIRTRHENNLLLLSKGILWLRCHLEFTPLPAKKISLNETGGCFPAVPELSYALQAWSESLFNNFNPLQRSDQWGKFQWEEQKFCNFSSCNQTWCFMSSAHPQSVPEGSASFDYVLLIYQLLVWVEVVIEKILNVTTVCLGVPYRVDY